ncbi:MAG: acyl-phosphate glycerol 3-phosphate acyltransferase [Elusimicrobia bacterium CG_4_9_14_3_um_filter_62_55]|nr:MAG: acyl-phosphate glycerol 3-phosphate acyltransferase [Elusimicrobia bacterium CG22_combo_CG10-13_8_21_14_all_63_91]PJA17710.1 MAG: acyl-phosphate glycerol 3-phosphate acyltransferase [Elusimicrobia bacterium CG_4_10_14_0_2_um_filter_63_34]PJB25887.1 MAG: acyl-phosphate glycerol 3-phosphate acyltransferase [Elusimicrobia bacterium CG_4_9_14_3_um_filter_62_55]
MLICQTMEIRYAAVSAASYLCGAVPFGFIVPKVLNGINILERGSGNPGAANVLYEAGPFAAMIVLLGDSIKGAIPVVAAGLLFPGLQWLSAVCGGAAILGHCWTPFLGFRGGKAVATSMGVFLALTPYPMSLTLVVFIAAVKLSGHISIGSMTCALVFPALILFTPQPVETRILAVSAGLLILYRHIPNIKLLLSHQEIG